METIDDETDRQLMTDLHGVTNGVKTMTQQAQVYLDTFGPWESTVLPKFVVFMAKKRRLPNLYALAEEYVSHLYQRQSIAPVTVTSGIPLSEEQTKKIKDKMAARLAVNDIKLIQKIDPDLL